MSSPTLTLHITWTIPPAQLPTFYEALHSLYAELVQEKQCLYFNVFEIEKQPGVVRLVEIWSGDMEWMGEVQSKKEYYAPFLEVAKGLALQPQKVEVMKGVAGLRFMRS